jgi:hypothetical protein
MARVEGMAASHDTAEVAALERSFADQNPGLVRRTVRDQQPNRNADVFKPRTLGLAPISSTPHKNLLSLDWRG